MSYYPIPVTKQCTQNILDQMNNLFFEIKGNDKDINNCCFCKIEYKNKKVPVIIINKYLIDLEFMNSIDISINNKLKTIKFGRTRLISEEFGLSIIEIIDNNLEDINFMEIDEKLNENESEMFYNKISIYIIQIDYKNEKSVSYGILNSIHNNRLFYFCNLPKNYKSYYIFDLSNNKIIGISNSYPKYYNKGIFLKFAINKFINRYKLNIKMKNEINILIKVNKEDINKEIYFFKNINNGLKKINKLNTEIYINDKLNECNNYFKPEKEGKYEIKLKFNVNLTDCSYMFAECQNIININFISFNTSLIKNMKYFFYGCNNLRTIDNLTFFDTKNVTDMSYMFYDCKN